MKLTRETIQGSRLYLYVSGLCRNWKECVLGGWNWLQLTFIRIPDNTVLIAEPNVFHGEVLPGYVKYFQDLGCRVLVLARRAVLKEEPFCRFENPPEQYCMTVWGMRKYLQSRKRRQYRHILLNSARAYIKEYRYYWRYTDFLGLNSGREKNICMIEHEFSADTYRPFFEDPAKNPCLMDELLHRTFVLTQFQYQGHCFPELNPCYFGKILVKENLNPEKRIFVAIGKISDKNRNFDELLNAVEQLAETVPYEVQIIGSGSLEHLSEKCRRHIKMLGRLSFEKMFECIEKTDFFLPLLEPEKQERYLTYCTSGSRQLILGFCKPPIIQEAFARHYQFDESNAVLYQTDFCEAMNRALSMTNDAYSAMVQSMRKEQERVYGNSLKICRSIS